VLCHVTEDVPFTDAYVYVFSSLFDCYQTNQVCRAVIKQQFFTWVISTFGMGKSHWEQAVLFTCNMGTDDSSTRQ
jgi:hypothetical protein